MDLPDTIEAIIKPNSSKNSIRFDEKRNLYLVNIKKKPENNKANIELIKFLSKVSNKKVKIIKGKTSKKKTIQFK